MRNGRTEEMKGVEGGMEGRGGKKWKDEGRSGKMREEWKGEGLSQQVTNQPIVSDWEDGHTQCHSPSKPHWHTQSHLQTQSLNKEKFNTQLSIRRSIIYKNTGLVRHHIYLKHVHCSFQQHFTEHPCLVGSCLFLTLLPLSVHGLLQ